MGLFAVEVHSTQSNHLTHTQWELNIVHFNKHDLATIGGDTHRMVRSVHCMFSCCNKAVIALNHPTSQVAFNMDSTKRLRASQNLIAAATRGL